MRTYSFCSHLHNKKRVTMTLISLPFYNTKYQPGGGGVLPLMVYTGRLRPKWAPFFNFGSKDQLTKKGGPDPKKGSNQL